MQRNLTFALISTVLTLFIGVIASRGAIGNSSDPPVKAGTAMMAHTKSADDDNDDSTTQIQRDGNGQFYLTAMVDGRDARFLVDTGADTVVLTVDSAQELGFDVDPANFEPVSETASGTGYGQMIEIDTIEIGGQKFHKVPAMVIDGLGTNLLGQTVLGRLGKMELRGDTMILHHGQDDES